QASSTTERYTLFLHDALPIYEHGGKRPDREGLLAALHIGVPPGHSDSDLRQAAVDGELAGGHEAAVRRCEKGSRRAELRRIGHRSEEHTSELQSREKLVCRLL